MTRAFSTVKLAVCWPESTVKLNMLTALWKDLYFQWKCITKVSTMVELVPNWYQFPFIRCFTTFCCLTCLINTFCYANHNSILVYFFVLSVVRPENIENKNTIPAEEKYLASQLACCGASSQSSWEKQMKTLIFVAHTPIDLLKIHFSQPTTHQLFLVIHNQIRDLTKPLCLCWKHSSPPPSLIVVG